MKKLVLVVALIASVFSASAQQTVGKIFSGPNEGKGFQLGSEKSTQIVWVLFLFISFWLGKLLFLKK